MIEYQQAWFVYFWQKSDVRMVSKDEQSDNDFCLQTISTKKVGAPWKYIDFTPL